MPHGERRLLSHILSWIFLVAAQVTAQLSNTTVDDLSAAVTLIPLEHWSNEGIGENGGTFSFSSSEDAIVIFTFPKPATVVYWQGFKRSDAAMYSVCIDCGENSDDASFIPVDGHDASAKPTDSVTILFAQTGLSNTTHNLTIKNAFDPRFNCVGQITLDAFIITSSQSTVPAVQSSAAVLPAGPLSTAVSEETAPPISTKFIIAIIFGGVTIFSLIFGVLWWVSRQERRKYSIIPPSILGNK